MLGINWKLLQVENPKILMLSKIVPAVEQSGRKSNLMWNLLFNIRLCINPLNAEINPICHLLALLGAHHILHISRIRVNALYMQIAEFLNVVYIASHMRYYVYALLTIIITTNI
jgi:hypothetical protein